MNTIGAHPQRLDLYVHPGDPIDFGVPVLNADGTSVNISGWTVGAMVMSSDGQMLHDFTPFVSGNQIRVTATSTATAAWAWSVYAARLVVNAAAPGGGPVPIMVGWIRLYRP